MSKRRREIKKRKQQELERGQTQQVEEQFSEPAAVEEETVTEAPEPATD